jgi:N-acetylneuraminate synthase
VTWNLSFSVGGREISIRSPTYFIADIAANHDGDLERAKALIWAAKQAGADCAKFQHFKAGKIVSAKGFEALGAQSAHQSSWKRSVVEVYDQYHTRDAWTDALVATCEAAGIAFMTTPYDLEALETHALRGPAIKIGSGDITWPAFITACAAKGLPMLLATGAATMAEVERAVEASLSVNPNLCLMQCNTNYSGSLENFRSVNLRVLGSFAAHWPGLPLGLSDHTPGHSAVLGAVALGARVIEKHFTDDNGREGPDHAFALNPQTWANMVGAVRELEAALGDGVKRVEANEAQTVVVQRRAVRASRDLAAGAPIGAGDLEVLRPCPIGAVEPHELDGLIGRALRAPKAAGEVFVWADLTS